MTIPRHTFLAALSALALAPGRAGAAEPLRLGTTGKETDAQAFYAAGAGLFDRAGIPVDISVLPNGAAIAAAISGGSLQLGNGNVLTVARAREKGLPFAIVALSAVYSDASPATVFAAAPDGPIRSAKDLNGKVVGGVSLGGLDQLSMAAWIDQNGGDASTVKFVEVRPSEVVPSLVRGTLAAANLAEPELSVERGHVRILGKSYSAVAKSFAQTAWFGRTDWVAQNAALARGFARVLQQAADWAAQPANHDKAAAYLAKYAKTDGANPHSDYARSLDPALVQPVLDGGLRYKLLDRPMNAADLFAPELLPRR